MNIAVKVQIGIPRGAKAVAAIELKPQRKENTMYRALRTVVSYSLILSLVCSGGCSVFQPKQQSVTITASDPRAEIYVDNNPVGTSPATVMLDRNKTYSVSARSSAGTGTAAIGRKISGTGVLDIVGGVFLLVPFVGCFTPGFWELDPTTVNIQTVK